MQPELDALIVAQAVKRPPLPGGPSVVGVAA